MENTNQTEINYDENEDLPIRIHFTVVFTDDTNFVSHIPLSAYDGEVADETEETVTYSYYVDEPFADRFERTLEDDDNVESFTRTFTGAN